MSSEECREDMYSPFEVSIGKFYQNMNIFREIVRWGEYRDLNFLQVAYLDSISWDFDKGVLDSELMSDLNSLCNHKALMRYIERPAINWESKREKKSKSMKALE